MSKLPEIDNRKSRVIADFRKFISAPKAKFYSRLGLNLVMGRREGIYFWDLKGKRYINCHCNGGVFNLGHHNPEIVGALEAAVYAGYDIGNHHLMSAPRAALARRLARMLRPGPLLRLRREAITNVTFAVAGGEAADLAIKLARGYTGRSRVLSLSGGYHGHTGLALAAGDPKYREPLGSSLPAFTQVPFADIDALKQSAGEDTAAIILESIPATLGMLPFPTEYVQEVRRLCDRRGIVLIMDEIQTGLGRTGKRWGFEHYDVYPDMVLLGKGLSGGMFPMAATCYRKKFEAVFRKDPFIHISTFGGAELGCFTAARVLDMADDPAFLQKINERADFFREEFEALRLSHEDLTEFRQRGLFMGLVFQDAATCLTFLKVLARHGIFAVYANNDKRVMQFLPPLITTAAEAREIMDIVRRSLDDLRSARYRLMRRAIGMLVK